MVPIHRISKIGEIRVKLYTYDTPLRQLLLLCSNYYQIAPHQARQLPGTMSPVLQLKYLELLVTARVRNAAS